MRGTAGGRSLTRIGGAAVLVAGVLCLTASGAVGQPTNEDYALLVLANQARSDPAAFGYPNPVIPPLVWNDGLAAAARAHSADMAENGCYQHNSCSGKTWWKRVESYYPGWTYLGQNIIAVGDDPRQLHDAWMRSAGHRANILSGAFAEFGAGAATGSGNFGPIRYSTEDFGTRALLSQRFLPAIPAGAVLPRTGHATTRTLVANYYDFDRGAPLAMRALVGGSCVDLALATGKPGHGTYAATRAFQGQGCVPLAFEAVKASGERYRFPSQGAILIAVGGASCDERATQSPAQDCGGAAPPAAPPAPTPTPTAVPEPGPRTESDPRLGGLRVALLAGPANASKGQINLTAILPDLPGFDPSGEPVEVAVAFASGDWARQLPALCGSASCLKANARRTTYRARYGPQGPQLSFVRLQDGRWRLRFSARGLTLGRLAPGPVTVSLRLGDLELRGAGDGELRENRLVVR